MTVGGTVLAHHLLDVVPQAALVAYVLYAAVVPHWAVPALAVTVGGGAVGLAAAALAAKYAGRPLRLPPRLAVRLRELEEGLAVLRSGAATAAALVLQSLGWAAEFFAVVFAFRAFGIDAPLAAAGAVVLLTNVATVFPLWPGNVGLLQAAVALPLLAYGVSYPRGLLFGTGLQAIEIVVAALVGFPSLAYEGLSPAHLRRRPRTPRSLGGPPLAEA
jgi:uncharacterized membrane protein YbhN (UPF0104 family)